jgi:hypothetical protein
MPENPFSPPAGALPIEKMPVRPGGLRQHPKSALQLFEKA